MNWRKGMRVLKWSLVGLAVLVLGLIATVSSIVATEPGSRWVLHQASRFLPLELGEIRGNLLTGLDLSYLEYRVEQDGRVQQRYRAEQASFRWQPFALMYSAVSVQSLHAERLLLVLPESKDDVNEPLAWPSFALPVRVELGQLQLREIQIARQTAVGEPETLVSFQSLSGSLSLGTFNFRVGDLALVADDYTLIANGRIGLRYPYDAQVDLLWQYQLEAQDADQEPLLFNGRANLEGDIRQLGLQHQLTSPLIVESRGQFLPNLSNPPDAIASLANPEVRLTSDWPLQPLLARWLPEGTPLPSLAGSLTLSGWLDNYQLSLNTRVETEEWPDFQLESEARGDLQHLTFDSLSGRLLDSPNSDSPGPASRLDIKGRFAWAPELAWDLALNAEALDPARFFPEWPGQISIQGRSQGRYVEEQLHLTLEDLKASGQLRGLALTAEGGLQLDDKAWQSPGLTLALGANRVHLAGQLQDNQLSVNWDLNAPLLHQLDTRLSGILASKGQVTGSFDEPRLNLTASARQLRWTDMALGDLELSLVPEAGEIYRLALALKQLKVGETLIKSFNVAGTGTLGGHQVQAQLDTQDLGRLALALDSGYDQGRWQGRLTEVDLRLPRLPRWRLLSSSAMVASGGQLDLGQICLTTRNGGPSAEGGPTPSLCTQTRWDDQGLALSGELESVPLRQLRSLLKPDVSLQGFIDGSFNLSLPPAQVPSAAFDFTTRGAELHYQYADDPIQIFPWHLPVFKGEWRDHKLNTQLVSDWAPYGQIQAQVQWDTASQQVTGKLDASFSDLTPLGALVPQADELRGQLVADLSISGPARNPQVEGQLVLTQGSAKVPTLGLDLQAIGLTLTSRSDGRLALDSRVTSGPGSLHITGELQGLGTPQWQLIGAMEGDNFQAVDQQQIRARISPALRLTASATETRLTGEARIPYARANIKSLPPTATRISEDVVIEEEGRVNGQKDTPGQLYVNVTAELGEDVKFNGFGLISRLAGRMSLIKTPERALLTTGYVGVAEGKYRAYGQVLTIQRGQLVFQGPYDNPGLDIRAQRLVRGTDDHIVGLQIGGTLQRPTSQVYSNPAVENEGEAMALLLTGKPLSEASAGDAYLIVSAMSGLGIDEGGGMTGKIAKAFSLDEVTINAEDGFEQSALWLGKQVTERLFVRYVVSLFEQANKLVVTYQISDRLRLEAESGASQAGRTQSADIIYKIER